MTKNESSAKKIYYADLDAARGLLMASTVIGHAADFYSDTGAGGIYGYISYALHIFRMPAFYIISGFFCFMSLEKYGVSKMLTQRAQRLLIPLFVIAFTLNIAELWLRSRIGIGKGDPFGPNGPVHYFFNADWVLHLWFLVVAFTLIALSALLFKLVPPVFAWLRVQRAKVAPGAIGNVYLIIPIAALSAYAAHAAGKIAPELVFPAFLGGVRVFTVLEYMPYFFAGAMLYYFPQYLEAVRRYHPLKWPLFVVVLSAWPAVLAVDVIPENGKVYVEAIGAWVMAVTFLGLMTSILEWTKADAYKIADSSYTVYLLHHSLVVVIGLVFMALPVPSFLKFLSMIAVAVVATVLIHRHVVLKSPTLRYLLNGKKIKSKPVTATARVGA